MPEILEQHRAAADFLPAAPCARQCPAGFVRAHVVGLGRDHQHDVVVDLDLEWTLAQAEPGRNLDRLHVAAAAEHADVAIILDRRLDLHPYPGALGKGLCDVLMRDLDEVGIGQYADEFVAQLPVGLAQILGRAELARVDLGIEVKIGLAQPIELCGVFIVQDGAEHAGQLREFFLVGLVKTALGNQPVDDVRLAQRNDAVALLARGDHGAGLDGRIHHKPPAGLGNASATRIRNLIATRTFIGPDSVSMPLRGSIGHGWHAASSPTLTVDHAAACPWFFYRNVDST